MTSNANWQGNLLINNKREILAGVIRNSSGFVVVAFRSKSYIDFDGFQTLEDAKCFAERAVE